MLYNMQKAYLAFTIGTESRNRSTTRPRWRLVASKRNARDTSCGGYETRDRGRTYPLAMPSANISCKFWKNYLLKKYLVVFENALLIFFIPVTFISFNLFSVHIELKSVCVYTLPFVKWNNPKLNSSWLGIRTVSRTMLQELLREIWIMWSEQLNVIFPK